MPVDDISSPPVDLEAFRAEMRKAGIEEVVPVALDTYREEATENGERLEAAIGCADPVEIAQASHAMRSGAGVIKARALAGLLQEMETAGHEGDLEATRALIEPVRSQAAGVLAYLERLAVRNYEA